MSEPKIWEKGRPLFFSSFRGVGVPPKTRSSCSYIKYPSLSTEQNTHSSQEGHVP